MANHREEGDWLAPGTEVCYCGKDGQGTERGVVVYSWYDESIGGFDCYVAFFGTEMPSGPPLEKPYILRYASSSLATQK